MKNINSPDQWSRLTYCDIRRNTHSLKKTEVCLSVFMKHGPHIHEDVKNITFLQSLLNEQNVPDYLSFSFQSINECVKREEIVWSDLRFCWWISKFSKHQTTVSQSKQTEKRERSLFGIWGLKSDLLVEGKLHIILIIEHYFHATIHFVKDVSLWNKKIRLSFLQFLLLCFHSYHLVSLWRPCWLQSWQHANAHCTQTPWNAGMLDKARLMISYCCFSTITSTNTETQKKANSDTQKLLELL